MVNFMPSLRARMRALLVSCLPIAHHVPLAWIAGSRCSWFSLQGILIPCAGWLAGMRGIRDSFIAHAILASVWRPLTLFGAASPLALLQVYHIPTMAAGLYLAGVRHGGSGQRMARGIVVAAMMVLMALFWLHPVGREAWWYALYWLIPVGLNAWGHRNRLAYALTATFIAHAVGSVAWIWSHATVAAYWTALVPLVAYERLLMGGMLGCALVALDILCVTRSKQGMCADAQAEAL